MTPLKQSFQRIKVEMTLEDAFLMGAKVMFERVSLDITSLPDDEAMRAMDLTVTELDIVLDLHRLPKLRRPDSPSNHNATESN